ncbi:peroxiredoxin, SACOL1771 subfamily [Marininema mesophilum]|uniref:Peroxiredoxin, SACOL1771 subfamily n=1 Tax=Marininema mesophilum TaxID=1048340 RepID=A0A1H2ZYU9_9BACL|nr:SACOL1771 family peroxiredoxin [Marininema mesophilum]SDX22361.1 peroxiredoxin, SACOL1771 subfamily [Marininema mesophilum]
MPKHEFRLTADWFGGRGGEGRIATGNLVTKVSIPEDMKGPGIGTNPDEMMIGAAATCYIITLAAMLERKKIPVRDLTLETVGIVNVEITGQKFESITHRPKVVLHHDVTVNQMEEARKATEVAEKRCMISNAIRGNVALAVEATVIQEK